MGENVFSRLTAIAEQQKSILRRCDPETRRSYLEEELSSVRREDGYLEYLYANSQNLQPINPSVLQRIMGELDMELQTTMEQFEAIDGKLSENALKGIIGRSGHSDAEISSISRLVPGAMGATLVSTNPAPRDSSRQELIASIGVALPPPPTQPFAGPETEVQANLPYNLVPLPSTESVYALPTVKKALSEGKEVVLRAVAAAETERMSLFTHIRRLESLLLRTVPSEYARLRDEAASMAAERDAL